MAEKNRSIITQKDVMILRQLLEDGRKSSASISKEIDLGREIVNYRIKRLIKENLIVKFVPKLNEEALHYQEYIILLKLNLNDEVSKEQFVKQNIGNKYLIWMVKSESGWDLIVRLYAESVEEFKTKLNEILEHFSSVLANYYTIISSEEIKENEKEVLAKRLFENEMTTQDFTVVKHSEPYHLDEKDKEILKLLEEDARVQYKEIAEDLDISSDTVKYRIEKMKSQGIIEQFTPVINFNKLGFFHYAAILRFQFLDRDEEEKVLDYLREHPSIIRAIKSLNAEEFFLSMIFEEERQVETLKEELMSMFPKVETLDIFSVE